MGNNLTLRAFELSDAPALRRLLNEPDLEGRRYIEAERGPLSLAAIEELLGRWTKPEHGARLAITIGDDLIGIGIIDTSWEPLAPMVSVLIDPARQRHGHGTEALEFLLDRLFGVGPALAAETWVDDWNGPGLAFAAAGGFREAGRARREGIRDGKYFDAVALDLTRAEWEAGRGA